MIKYLRLVTFIGALVLNVFQISFASVVSTEDFNKDFFVTWSPSHVNTSDDGTTRSLKLDKESERKRIYLWFDPTAEFHTYSILWNIHQIVFMVDWVPIRTYRNHADKGVAFPRWQPMSIKISLWNGDSWATRGGKDKVDWSKGPFIASFRNYKIDACVWKGNPRFCRADSSTNWWNQKKSSSLTWAQRRLFKWD
ncbi:xyloglucan endotransglucosylase/hydrolase 10 [Actinidia rufa]|uniref:Xyloglucan endotransglucosylase/hydrolase 10 n=1 Tax=Actinidia rufa TaxID=165716 RepID=A0A7J0H2C7_9ERIC|nr:xyloglucan endotransglucosylase/hydrolase 10 [Actinidia rufa]